MTDLVEIDLNADIGEGMPFDEELIKYISSCNIACGGHVGDDHSTLKTLNLAKKHIVKIGAHPSYPDRINFGRKTIDISIKDLIQSIDFQLHNFKNKCEQINVVWHHIKFHGALYNDIKLDNEKALALVNLISEKYPEIILYVPPNSEIKRAAKGKIMTCVEGFADRAYNEDLSLVPRSVPGAVILKTEKVIQQVNDLLLFQKVNTINGTYQPINIQTLCLHGDTPGALELTKAIVEFLNKNNILIK